MITEVIHEIVNDIKEKSQETLDYKYYEKNLGIATEDSEDLDDNSCVKNNTKNNT